jgi:inner membrane protein
MDTLTHAALGACVGEAFAGKRFGKKAMLWGAVAGNIPDIDVLPGIWMDIPDVLLSHRGFTHSIMGCILFVILLTALARKFHPKHSLSTKKWAEFFALAIFSHIFVDAFNNYGIGWFEPFSHARISFNAIYVVDPFFSILPIACAIMLLIMHGRKWSWRKWWLMPLTWISLYLIYCLLNKWEVDRATRKTLRQQNIPYTHFITTPAPLQNWLWFVVVKTDSGYYTGYRSVFDTRSRTVFKYFPRNEFLADNIQNKESYQKLVRFSQGYYTLEKWHDTLVFNDLRFGQTAGWYDPRGNFAFHYFLQPEDDNLLVVQRGRFGGWNRKTFRSMIRRIKGN